MAAIFLLILNAAMFKRMQYRANDTSSLIPDRSLSRDWGKKGKRQSVAYRWWNRVRTALYGSGDYIEMGNVCDPDTFGLTDCTWIKRFGMKNS